jgi:hypothetical protein
MQKASPCNLYSLFQAKSVMEKRKDNVHSSTRSSRFTRQTSKVNIQVLKIQAGKDKVINKSQIKKPPVFTFVLRKNQLLMNLLRLMMKLKSKFVNLQTIWGSYPYPGRVETICLYPQSLEYLENSQEIHSVKNKRNRFDRS